MKQRPNLLKGGSNHVESLEPRLVLLLMIPTAAWADFSGTATVPAGMGLNLATGAVGIAGGDLVLGGSVLTPQGNAKAVDIGNGIGTGFIGR